MLPPLTASIDYQNPIYSTPTAEKTDWEAPEFHTSSFDDPSLRGETDTVPLLSLFLHPPFVLSRSLVYIYIYILFTPLNPGQFSRIKPRSGIELLHPPPPKRRNNARSSIFVCIYLEDKGASGYGMLSQRRSRLG